MLGKIDGRERSDLKVMLEVKSSLIDLSRKEEKKSAVEQRRQFATRRRLMRTSSCGILLDTRFGIHPALIDPARRRTPDTFPSFFGSVQPCFFFPVMTSVLLLNHLHRHHQSVKLSHPHRLLLHPPQLCRVLLSLVISAKHCVLRSSHFRRRKNSAKLDRRQIFRRC